MTPEEIREFEKTGKALSRFKGGEVLFDEDYTGRMKYACWAMNGEKAPLDNIIGEILTQDGGARYLVRALNNIRTIGHAGAVFLTGLIYRAVEDTFDVEARHQKILQLLDSVSDSLRTGMGWLSERAALYLGSGEFSREQKLTLWLHWCAAMLRSCSDAALFIDSLGPVRPQNLRKSDISMLRDAIADAAAAWDLRSAAVYLLLGNHLISVGDAQSFAEDAYAAFPLEGLEGAELLSIAVENDAARLAEIDVMQDKLAQVRRENLILRNMSPENFSDASSEIFEKQADLPDTPLELALALQTFAKNPRIIATIFIDDTRKAEWIAMASKNPNALRQYALTFFEHFVPENPILRNFSIELVTALLDVCGIDARMAENWCENAEKGDAGALKNEVGDWIDLLK